MYRSRNVWTMLAVGVALVSAQPALAVVIWNLNSSQSFLQLGIPTQPAKVNNIATGNLFMTNQGANSGPWNAGNKAFIAGTLSTDFVNGTSIRFRTGEHVLTGQDSGSYAPDFDNWNSTLGTFAPPNAVEPAVFGGEVNFSQVGSLLIVANDVARFALQDVLYNLSSGVILLSLNQFSANATAFSMTDAKMGIRGSVSGGLIAGLPSYFDTASNLNFTISGTNAAATATITSSPGLLTLTLPISVPLSWSLYGTNYTGTAQGTIVATTAVPEPSSLVLTLVAGLLLAGPVFRRASSLRQRRLRG